MTITKAQLERELSEDLAELDKCEKQLLDAAAAYLEGLKELRKLERDAEKALKKAAAEHQRVIRAQWKRVFAAYEKAVRQAEYLDVDIDTHYGLGVHDPQDYTLEAEFFSQDLLEEEQDGMRGKPAEYRAAFAEQRQYLRLTAAEEISAIEAG